MLHEPNKGERNITKLRKLFSVKDQDFLNSPTHHTFTEPQWFSSRKTPYFFDFAKSHALLTMPKPLTVWITINCGKF